MPAIALLLPALLAATAPAQPETVDCTREVAEARALFREHAAERLRFAAPLARTVRRVIDRTLSDEDREVIRAFQAGEATAGELDLRIWPKLRQVFARFNAADCRHLGGVAGVEELVDGLTAMRGGPGLHTAVLVTCAERLPGHGSRRFVGLRVLPGEDGPSLALQGVIEGPQLAFVAAGEEAPRRRVVVRIPLGDRASEDAALRDALAEYTGTEEDFTWIVPPVCAERLSGAAQAY